MGGKMLIDVDEAVEAKAAEGGVLLSDVVSQYLQVVTVGVGLGFVLIKPVCQVLWHSPSWCQSIRLKQNSKGATYRITPPHTCHCSNWPLPSAFG